ncbi:MAG: hypothetical protein ACREAZ_06165, partial [Nitrososphaera sp.]
MTTCSCKRQNVHSIICCHAMKG